MAQDFYIDIHCHPSIKPYSRAYPGNTNSSNVSHKNSIWNYDPPTWLDKILNRLLTVTKFSQANFTALYNGNVRVVIISINPIEKGFFSSRPGSSKVMDIINNFVTEIGKEKINFIRKNNNYFSELVNEYNYYRQLDGRIVTVNGQDLQYKLTSSHSEIEGNLEDTGVISVVISFEGGHVFNQDSNCRAEEWQILNNIAQVKSWPHKPIFVSLTHHFYNEFGGHAKSLSGSIAGKVLDQSYGLDTGITGLGKQVIESLLDSTHGRRIYIDIKHMSRKLRMDYYKLLETAYLQEDIPIIVSHGALNGNPSVYDMPNKDGNEKSIFYDRDINFFDDEIVKIAMTKGIFGIQLDDRVISSKSQQRKINRIYYSKEKKLKLRGTLVWNHIQHIAELLDRHGLYAWGTTAIGSDFDGMVDPPFGYWTSKYLPLLHDHLLENANHYMQNGNNVLREPHNKSESPDKIIKRIFSENAMEFLSRYY